MVHLRNIMGCGNELYTLILCFLGWQSQLNPDGTLLQTKADGA